MKHAEHKRAREYARIMFLHALELSWPFVSRLFTFVITPPRAEDDPRTHLSVRIKELKL